MLFPVRSLAVTLVALVADEGLFLGVGSEVVEEVVPLHEHLLTVLKFTFKNAVFSLGESVFEDVNGEGGCLRLD